MHLFASAFSSWLSVMATFLHCPKISVNCKRTKRIFCSFTMRMISSLVNRGVFAISAILLSPTRSFVSLTARPSKENVPTDAWNA